MRFYDFDTKNFSYSALIGAKDESEAIVYYTSMVADIEENDGSPIEIGVEDAFNRLMAICKDNNEMKEAKEEFEDYYNKNNEPYLVLIDISLL